MLYIMLDTYSSSVDVTVAVLVRIGGAGDVEYIVAWFSRHEQTKDCEALGKALSRENAAAEAGFEPKAGYHVPSTLSP